MKLRSLQIFAVLIVALCAFAAYHKGPTHAAAIFFAGALTVDSIVKRRDGRLCVYSGTILSDLFIPKVYAAIIPNDTPRLTAFAMSGVAVTNPLLDAAAKSGTKTIEVPLWNDLTMTDEPRYSDDTDTDSTPGKIGTGSLNARNAYMNKSYGAADLAVEIGNSTPGQGNPMTRIKNRFGTYWSNHFQDRILAATLGIFNRNVASESGDMVHDVSLQTTVGQAAANWISAEAVVEAAFTMGDAALKSLSVIAMHSVVYKRLVKQDLITFVKNSTGTLDIPTYLGKTVVVDDSLPVIAGTTSGFRYVTVLYGRGAFGYGEGSPAVPAETFREPTKGSGGGLEQILERKTWMIHPAGYNWTETTVTAPAFSPTLANLRLAANWSRTFARKSVNIAFLVTNG